MGRSESTRVFFVRKAFLFAWMGCVAPLNSAAAQGPLPNLPSRAKTASDGRPTTGPDSVVTSSDSTSAIRPSPSVAPSPYISQENAEVPSLPEVERAAQANRNLARNDVGGLRSNWSNTPVLVGDGGGPQATGGRISIGRIMIEAAGLTQSGATLTGSGPTQLGNFQASDADLNSIQAINTAGYPSFTLPTQPLGAVPGSDPVTLAGAGIGGISDPGGAYQAAAQNAFEIDPNLPGTNGIAGTATFNQGASGSLPNGSEQDAFLFYDYFIDASILFPGYAVGFVKLTENMSPIPRDRVYMNYSYFKNANFFGARADANRFTPGFEKTFFDGWTSIEIRAPFAGTLDNTQSIIGTSTGQAEVSQFRDVQFGNMSVIFKTMLLEQKTWAITGGVQTMLPTADNTFVNGPTATGENIQHVFVANESVHVMPFVGGIWAPNDRFFNQFLFQIDCDANGNPAYVNSLQNPALRGRDLQLAGRSYYPTFMYLSFGTGYWLYKNDAARFTGFSPVMELHVNQAFQEFRPIHYQGYQLGQNPGVLSITNALIGCNFEWTTRSTLTFAYVTPLGGGVDRFFDGELRAIYNWRFGPQNRLRRVQF